MAIAADDNPRMPEAENAMSCDDVREVAVPVEMAPTWDAVSASSTVGPKAANWPLFSAPMFWLPSDVICAVVSAAICPLLQALVPALPSPATPPADSAATWEVPNTATSAVARNAVCAASRTWICAVVSASAWPVVSA